MPKSKPLWSVFEKAKPIVSRRLREIEKTNLVGRIEGWAEEYPAVTHNWLYTQLSIGDVEKTQLAVGGNQSYGGHAYWQKGFTLTVEITARTETASNGIKKRPDDLMKLEQALQGFDFSGFKPRKIERVVSDCEGKILWKVDYDAPEWCAIDSQELGFLIADIFAYFAENTNSKAYDK